MSDVGASRIKDREEWRIGTDRDVAWINDNTPGGLAITSAIPPVFDDYATLELPGKLGVPRDHADRGKLDQALLALLQNRTLPQPWWLGYLETGTSDIVFSDAPKVTLYAGWRYVLVHAGPEQAATWRPRDDWSNWKSTELPDLMFPDDRSWLASTLWDDDWTCLGGSTRLIADLLADRTLGRRARRVTLDQNATPPGHIAL